MASREKPRRSEQDVESVFSELEASLLSMENIDRASPELWPEKIPGVSAIVNRFSSSSTNKPPYSKKFTSDKYYLRMLASLSTTSLVSKVKQLHDIAFQLGVEESKELTRGKCLNLFKELKD